MGVGSRMESVILERRGSKISYVLYTDIAGKTFQRERCKQGRKVPVIGRMPARQSQA